MQQVVTEGHLNWDILMVVHENSHKKPLIISIPENSVLNSESKVNGKHDSELEISPIQSYFPIIGSILNAGVSNPQVPESDQDKKLPNGLPNGILLNNTTTDRINSRKESLESIETVDTVDLELIKLGPELVMGFLEKGNHKLQDKKPKVGSRGVLFKGQRAVVPIC